MKFAAIIFIVLHVPGGQEITIAANEIVSMRAAPPNQVGNKLITGEARCLINTEDGKFISVIETCAEVRELIRQEIERLPNNRG